MINMSPISRLRSLRVIDVMNRSVIKINAQQSMTEIAKEFFDHDISAAPVVDEFDHCVGILSAADFLRRDADWHQPALPPLQQSENDNTGKDGANDGSDIVSSYMSTTVRSVSPQTWLLDAAVLMNDKHVHRLPVVDENNHVVGMISTMDVVAAVINSVDEMELSTTKRGVQSFGR